MANPEKTTMQNQTPNPTPENLLNQIATTYEAMRLHLEAIRVLADCSAAAVQAGRFDREKAAEVLRQAQNDVLATFQELASGEAFKAPGKAH
jgi:hypothetical protein